MLPTLCEVWCRPITRQNPSDLYDVMKRFNKQQIMFTFQNSKLLQICFGHSYLMIFGLLTALIWVKLRTMSNLEELPCKSDGSAHMGY